MRLLEVLRDSIERVLDTIVPPRARSARTKERAAADIPLMPTVHELLGTRITTLMDYRAPAVQDLIRALKYDKSAHAAKLAATVLADYLEDDLADAALYTTREALLVPVPLHRTRARERGFNQIELVLDALPAELRSRLARDVLVRTRKTSPQTRLPRAERLSNVAGAFALREGVRVERVRVYLVDDVTTTGATLVNAGNVLKRAGAEVSLIALARA